MRPKNPICQSTVMCFLMQRTQKTKSAFEIERKSNCIIEHRISSACDPLKNNLG